VACQMPDGLVPLASQGATPSRTTKTGASGQEIRPRPLVQCSVRVWGRRRSRVHYAEGDTLLDRLIHRYRGQCRPRCCTDADAGRLAAAFQGKQDRAERLLREAISLASGLVLPRLGRLANSFKRPLGVRCFGTSTSFAPSAAVSGVSIRPLWPITLICRGGVPVTGLVTISIPITSTFSAAPRPSPPTMSEPVCSRTFAPSGTYTVDATCEAGIFVYATANDQAR
jgi:hypothetical protein